jgi:UDP-GlcNAc:undecaprenyl-phosphate GlcNAc-1-phosphate transferase
MPVTVGAFLGALLLSLLLTPVAMRVAALLGVIDRPDKGLKRHRAPTPYFGGVAIYVAAVSAVLAAKAVETGSPRGVVGMLAGATVVFLLGLWDDFTPLGPRFKLVVQAMAAAIPIYFGVHIKFIANPAGAAALTMFWLVGVTNAFNLLDIKDGLCGGVAAVAAGWFWLIAGTNGRTNDALTAAALAGAAIGFLRYNLPPARVFMGDAGSLFLGFILASVAIGQGYSLNTNLGVIAPLLILGIPIFETLFVMAVRWQQGKPVLMGSPDHIVLRLIRMGRSPERAVAVLVGAGVVLGVLAWAVTVVNWERALLIGGAVGVAALLAAIRLASVDMSRPAPARREGGPG